MSNALNTKYSKSAHLKNSEVEMIFNKMQKAN